MSTKSPLAEKPTAKKPTKSRKRSSSKPPALTKKAKEELEKKKAQNAIVAGRVMIVYEMLLNNSYTQIVKFGIKEWPVSERTIGRYIRFARKLLADTQAKQREEAFAEQENRFLYLYSQALEKRNYTLARDILKDLNEMHGLNSPIQLDIRQDIRQHILLQAPDDGRN